MTTDRALPDGYMPSLDGLRGFACLMVVAAHITRDMNVFGADTSIGYVFGSTGVLIFFALSGFLMGTLYLRQSFYRDNAARYVIARFSRITPAYYIAIAFALCLAALLPNFVYAMDPVMAARSFAFMGSAGVFWSIPPEVQFYGFFLIVWAAYDAFVRGIRWPLYLLVAVCIALVWSRDLWGGILLPSKLHIFLFGMLASGLIWRPPVRAVLGQAVMQAALVAGVIAYVVLFVTKDTLYNDLLLAGLVAVMIVALSYSSIVTRFFELDFMRSMGHASFSIYLFHDPLLHTAAHFLDLSEGVFAVNLLICVAVALPAPVLFHYLAEKPLNRATKQKALALYQGACRRWGSPNAGKARAGDG